MTFFQVTLGKKKGIPGIVFAIQTFGDYARWHPHLHALVADGLFLESGYFYVMPKVDLQPLAELFRASVLKMLKKEGLIDDAFITMIMKWCHNSGFSVHNQVRIKPEDEKGIENLAQISDQRETSIYYPQYLFAFQGSICQRVGNSVVPLKNEPWKEQEEFSII